MSLKNMVRRFLLIAVCRLVSSVHVKMFVFSVCVLILYGFVFLCIRTADDCLFVLFVAFGIFAKSCFYMFAETGHIYGNGNSKSGR